MGKNGRFINKVKRTPVSTWIFRGILLFIIVIAVVASIVVNNMLSDYLESYESARPEYVAEEYFCELFLEDNYNTLYSKLDLATEGVISAEEFDLYFKSKVGEGKITYEERSAGLSGNSKYAVLLDGEEIGGFLLEPSGEKNEAGFDLYKKSTVNIEFDQRDAYIVRVQKGSAVYVNGVLLDESFKTDEGTLITGDYEIYSVVGFYNPPVFSAKINSEDCYIIKTATDRVFTDEVFNEIPDVKATTIRVIKGHTVYTDGEKVSEEYLVEGASGYVNGFYFGEDKMEYVVYSIPKTATEIKILDKNGDESAVRKIDGGDIYSECAIGISGVMEFYALGTTKVYLAGSLLTEKYISENNIKTESWEYVQEGMTGLVYNKYTVYWVGEEPLMTTENIYKKESSFVNAKDLGLIKNCSNIPAEDPYNQDLAELYGADLTEIAKAYSKMMIRYETKANVLSHFEKNSAGYKQVNQVTTSLLSKPDSYKFLDESVSDFCMYSDNIYSGTVHYTVETRVRTTVQTVSFNYSFYFKVVDEQIVVFNLVNEGV